MDASLEGFTACSNVFSMVLDVGCELCVGLRQPCAPSYIYYENSNHVQDLGACFSFVMGKLEAVGVFMRLAFRASI